MIHSFTYYQPPRKKNHSKIFFIIVIFFVFTAVGYSLYYWFIHIPKKDIDQKIVSPLPKDIGRDVGRVLGIKKDSKELKAAVDTALEGTKGIYGVAIKNITTGEDYYFQEDRRFQTASIYKIWVMAEAYRQIQHGELREDEVLSNDIETLNKRFNIASEEAELKEGKVSYTVKNALEKMIIYSDNYSALSLTVRIKLANLQKFIEDNNFENSSTGKPPYTTAADIALFFEKLYRGELADEVHTKKMFDLLKKQAHVDKLPKYLPEPVVLAHKTGELDKFAHDAGIVFTPKGDYIIVVLSESGLPYAASDRIGLVSKAVYDYFQK